MADLLDRILQRVSTLAPDVPGDVLTRVEVDLRAELGGTDGGYIARRPALRHAETLGLKLRTGVPLDEAIKACGIKRRQGYNILSRPLTKRPR
jgi:hypothetical protein